MKENSTMYKEFASVLAREGKPNYFFDVFHKTGCSFFMSICGFTYSEVKEIMKKFLLSV